MALRAARIRSTAASRSNSGRGRVAGRILDRQSRHAGLHGQPDALRDARGIGGKAVFEVGVDGQIGGLDHVREMLEHPIARHAAVRRARATRRSRNWWWPAP